jgi:site-specific recombinase XerD
VRLYRRHKKDCKHSGKGAGFTRCDCPIWCDGIRDGVRVRESLKTFNWKEAEKSIERLDSWKPTLREVVDAFTDDQRGRSLATSTIEHYRHTLAKLREFCGDGVTFASITADTLSAWRASMTISATTSNIRLEHVRALWNFAMQRDWVTKNVAKSLRRAKATAPGALPYTREEVTALLAAADGMKNPNKASVERAKLRARAFVLVLLYTGLRLTDAVKLRRDAIDTRTGYMIVRTEKTGQPIKVIVHPEALEALRHCPNESAEYCFWNGVCDPVTRAHSLRRTVYNLGKAAGIHAHPHRFRDTFACWLLEEGVDIRTVSLLLGHRSVRTTERHYAHFVKAHQARLDEAVGRMRR